MLQVQFSLAWDQHMSNISNGLSQFQKDNEFVDMTLAAEGQRIKVHKIVMSLISPYMKDLISSADCPHPVVFLNKVSYATLCSLLEYVYKGEVLVAQENVADLIQAGKELQIKGLGEMNPHVLTAYQSMEQDLKEVLSEDTSTIKDTTEEQDTRENIEFSDSMEKEEIRTDNVNIVSDDNDKEYMIIHNTLKADSDKGGQKKVHSIDKVRYTISNQGSLQMILNKYLYYSRYTSTSASRHRVWKCVEYCARKCPAYVISRDDIVLKRLSVHTHPNHEIRIKKKMWSGEIFDNMELAEQYAIKKKKI